jgi:glutamate synthase domain-containing protein 2
MLVRQYYLILSALGIASLIIIPQIWAPFAWFAVIIIPYILIGFYDLFVSRSNVLRNYPVIGHLRYGLEFISPEIRQYFVETEHSGRPFNREQRTLVYRRSDGKDDLQPFGTQYDVATVGYETAEHSLSPKKVPETEARTVVGGRDCTKTYSASRLNISAMSFGALSPNAIEALNSGAKLGNFAHNTGEGGLSKYHLAGGGDIFWQIGTGYFGCRTKDGHFDPVQFAERSNIDVVKMIEIKLSQGAKPSHGGVLPGAKVNEEIAEVRGVPVGRDCISPPTHSTFSNPQGLLEFVANLREHSGGKPTGFKLCIGRKSEFMGICKAMVESGVTPDFITVDGSEGGTGAAPLEFSDRLGMTANEGLIFVHNCLVGIGKRDQIKLISSGKIATGFDMVQKIALGADMCNAARTMLFAIGCIQAVRCNTNTCPSGVATQDWRRMRAVVVDERKYNVANFHRENIRNFLELVGAMGLSSPDELTPFHIYRRLADETQKTYGELYQYLEPGELLDPSGTSNSYTRDWKAAKADAF